MSTRPNATRKSKALIGISPMSTRNSKKVLLFATPLSSVISHSSHMLGFLPRLRVTRSHREARYRHDIDQASNDGVLNVGGTLNLASDLRSARCAGSSRLACEVAG